jgi:hypothetical protein
VIFLGAKEGCEKLTDGGEGADGVCVVHRVHGDEAVTVKGGESKLVVSEVRVSAC